MSQADRPLVSSTKVIRDAMFIDVVDHKLSCNLKVGDLVMACNSGFPYPLLRVVSSNAKAG